MAEESYNTGKTEIKQTGDGSDTLISETFDQPYHSLSGAVAESRYVYFEANGLSDALSAGEDLCILEIGFGTGMNLVLLLDYLSKSSLKPNITFISAEAWPIEPEIAKNLNFGKEVGYQDYSSLLETIFTDLKPGWNKITITEQVTLLLFVGTFGEMNFISGNQLNTESAATDTADLTETTTGGKIINQPFDFVLHDPFSPESNPAGWTSDLFSKIAAAASDNVMLTTYSAATSARAAMATAGWYIARAPGALGKREMTVASKNPEKLSHLKRVNEKRLVERFEDGDFE